MALELTRQVAVTHPVGVPYPAAVQLDPLAGSQVSYQRGCHLTLIQTAPTPWPPFHTSCSKSHVLILPEHELFNHNNVENHAMSQLLFCIRSDTTAYASPFLAILTRQGTAK